MTDTDKEAVGMPLPRLDQFDFHPHIASMTGTTLVMFSSPGCGGCRHLRGVLGEVRRLRPGWHLFEVDAQRDPALTNEFEVFHLPTIFLFQDGIFHCQLQTEARPSAVIQATTTALRQAPLEAP